MRPEEFLSMEEFKLLLDVCKDEREKSILLLLGGVGLRAAELVNIRVDDIDLAKGFLYVTRGKGGRRRTVVLLPVVKHALEKYLQTLSFQSIYLFPSIADDHIGTRRLQDIVDNIAIRAGLQQVSYIDKAADPESACISIT